MPYIDNGNDELKFVDTYKSEQKTGESLEQWYRRLAKVADQRIVRLESYQHDLHYKHVLDWSYKKALKDIKKWSGEHASRFNTKPPENPEQLIAKINDIRSFLSKPTSSKAGIIAVYKKRTDTINEKFGTSFTWQSLANYYESGTSKKWDNKFGSDTALNTIGEIQKNKDEIIEMIDEGDEVHLHVDDEMLAITVQQALADDSLDISSLI